MVNDSVFREKRCRLDVQCARTRNMLIEDVEEVGVEKLKYGLAKPIFSA